MERGGLLGVPPVAAGQAQVDLLPIRVARSGQRIQRHPMRDLVRRDEGRLGQAHKSLDALEGWQRADGAAQRDGEDLAHAPQASQDDHASEDRHDILVPIDRRVAPQAREDEHPREAQDDPEHRAQVVVPYGQALDFLLAHPLDPSLHGVLPSVALDHADAEESLAQGPDAAVDLLRVLQHVRGQRAAPVHGHHQGWHRATHDDEGGEA
mmetsp:Transcript_123552/g.354941  ORF Transcript_123552/g.354941 Transcript_123552/m.354941 type:complete len:209 (-) Transcript_123552:433-1059(-)